MSKREPTRIHATKVKKRRGVGSRVITVLDSDEDDPVPTASSDYARVTKTRVAASTKVEKVSMNSIPVFEEDQLSVPTLLEETVDSSLDVVVENIIAATPAKQRKRANDSVSYLVLSTLHITKNLFRPRCAPGLVCGLSCLTT